MERAQAPAVPGTPCASWPGAAQRFGHPLHHSRCLEQVRPCWAGRRQGFNSLAGQAQWAGAVRANGLGLAPGPVLGDRVLSIGRVIEPSLSYFNRGSRCANDQSSALRRMVCWVPRCPGPEGTSICDHQYHFPAPYL